MYLVNKKLKVLKVPDKTLKAVMFLSYSETHKHETVITYFAFTPIYTTSFYLRSQRVAMGNALLVAMAAINHGERGLLGCRVKAFDVARIFRFDLSAIFLLLERRDKRLLARFERLQRFAIDFGFWSGN